MLKENTALVVIPAILEPFVVQGIIQLDGTGGPLTSEQEEALCTYIHQGGSLLCLGAALENYHEYPRLGELLGNVVGNCTPETELIINVANNNHYLTRRTDSAFAIVESVYLLNEIPEDATLLWQTSWHFTRRPVAYARSYGRGQIICTILGTTPTTLSHPNLQQFIGRAYRFLQGVESEEQPTRVAMIGYGAIGFEHGSAISAVPGLEYSVVCDRNLERLKAAQKAFPGVRTCMELTEIENDPEIDLVIISTPPNTHAEIALQMLRAGKHVVCEKPFCLTTAEADEMIKVAQEKQLTLTIYQCRRWDPDFLAIQRVLQAGTIGKVFHLETFIGGYGHPCDYWHSHEPISGGVFYDWGSHYLDWILQLIPQRVVSVRGVEHKLVWHDVTNADQS
ncbi:MAG TPA: Gfo/Idh/MocA family oxidoreductase, partial [Ktedonobacteraceae bacterium]|nr:Gfo/Idh/MocA family oxidoreductase [Ktedonobacteraceae bacterium]